VITFAGTVRGFPVRTNVDGETKVRLFARHDDTLRPVRGTARVNADDEEAGNSDQRAKGRADD